MKKPQIFALFVVIGIGALGVLLFRSGGHGDSVGETASTWNIFSSPKDTQTGEIAQEGESVTAGTNVLSKGYDLGETVRYVNTAYGFSFEKPKRMTATSFAEEMGETIVLQETQGSDNFQIFVLPWDEPDYAVMTAERIRQDIPDMVIEEPQEAVLADGTHALLFWSKEEGSGKTREVWIIHGAYLYEVSALANMDSLLARIMGTWKFE